MKKIAIVTIYDNNIGNRLQNYALQTFLENMKMDVSCLRHVNNVSLKSNIKKYIKIFLGYIGLEKYRLDYWQIIRNKKFNKFNQLNIKLGEVVNIDKEIKVDSNEYDYFITGSDQVWHNWNKGRNELDYFYLNFAEDKKRIAYAPSFGFTQFPKCDFDKHLEGIKGINALSCREEDGCELIYITTGRYAERLIDPTFLLDPDEWRSIAKRPIWFKKKNKIIVTYFLGKVVQDYEKYIMNLSSKMNAQVINIYSKNNKNEYSVSPEEFVYLIDNADYVCTDSFHACAFSLILEKQFVTFPRKEDGMEDMKGRIETLFKVFKIKSRWYTDLQENLELNLGYKGLINIERERARRYFMKNIK